MTKTYDSFKIPTNLFSKSDPTYATLISSLEYLQI